MFHVKHTFPLALVALLPCAAWAQSFECFTSTKYDGQYTAVPTQSQYINTIVFSSPSTLVSQAIPMPKTSTGTAQTLLVCPTANGNYELTACSATGCAVSGTMPASNTTSITNGKAANFTPNCMTLNAISGTMPSVWWASVDSTATIVRLPYWKVCGS